jgi:hypothetical protein
MMGWVGPTTPAADLFEELPELRQVLAWDPGTQRYQGVTALKTGQGLWLEFGGDGPAQVTVPVSDGSVLLSLDTGRNLVGWAGADGTAIEEAVGRFGDGLLYAYRWDARGQRFDLYAPGGGDFNTITELSRGDALWLVLAEETRWWQSGTGRTLFSFGEGVSAGREVEVRSALANVIGFFAEQYGIEPPEFTLSTGEESPTSTVTFFVRRPQATETEVYSQLSVDTHTSNEDLEVDLAQKYFHVLQANLARKPDMPSWMTAGAATYAGAVYGASLLARDGATIRQSWHYDSARFIGRLKSIEVGAASSVHFRRTYDLGAMAVDWLSGHAARRSGTAAGSPPGKPIPLREQGEHDAFIQYYRLLASSETWQDAFETAFKISPEDFYKQFELYREDLAGPVIVTFGNIPAATYAAYAAELNNTYTFFIETLGVRPFPYFLYLADEASGRATYRDLYHPGLPDSSPYNCLSGDSFSIFHVVTCRDALTHSAYLGLGGYFHVLNLRVDLGAEWLGFGIQLYTERRYAASAGRLSYALELAKRTFLIEHFDTTTLSQLVDRDSWHAAHGLERWSLAFVAVDRLVQRSEKGVLAEYLRLLPRGRPGEDTYVPGAGSWEAAFEQAFGLTVDEFYDDFAEYRAGLSQP